MRIYNTLKKGYEDVKFDKIVKMYVCGITAYDYSHIGHARSAVFFDTIRRFLEYLGHEVIYVQNFTDVDDKIIKRAVEEGKTQKEVADRFIEEFLRDMEELNVRRATYHPKVTDHIQEIIEAVKRLVEAGYAYEVEAENGKDVYFHVPSFESYGKLSGISLDELNRHRVEPDPRKKDVKDFALWKAAKEDDLKAEAVFDSPWGKGRPGWHIECSVLSTKYLGTPFDIHGGGKDLVFPHHENERAQSFALYGVEPVRYWLHNDFVTIEGEKMSKSLGNIIRIRDGVREFGGEVLRYFLISAHYRTPLDYSRDAMERANKSYEALLNTVQLMDMELAYMETFREYGESAEGETLDLDEYEKKFVQAMEDDFNTPRALAVLHEASTYINRMVSGSVVTKDSLQQAFDTFIRLCNILGLFEKYKRVPVLSQEDVRLIKEREEARKRRDFKKADAIRDGFREKGIQLIDTPKGTRWRRIEV